jgi:hypothetical protein
VSKVSSDPSSFSVHDRDQRRESYDPAAIDKAPGIRHSGPVLPARATVTRPKRRSIGLGEVFQGVKAGTDR